YFLFQRSVAHRHLHSFPTRRSSDLADLERRRAVYRIPREFWKLRKQGVIIPFLLELCRPFQVGAAPFLRGFYFTGFREKTAHSDTGAPDRGDNEDIDMMASIAVRGGKSRPDLSQDLSHSWSA